MKGKGNKPKRLPTSFWGWIAPVYSASEDEVIRVAGVDAAMYLRLLAFGALEPCEESSTGFENPLDAMRVAKPSSQTRDDIYSDESEGSAFVRQAASSSWAWLFGVPLPCCPPTSQG